MGYSHYFSIKGEVTPEMYKEFVAEAHEILRTADIYTGIDVADAMGEVMSAWQADNEAVSFNGYGENSHETFYVTPSSAGFNFCKTAEKPYDAVVVACLIAMGRAYGDAVKISSDGNASDWADGSHLYQMAVQRTAIIPLPVSA